jgi:hypothetical protein
MDVGDTADILEVMVPPSSGSKYAEWVGFCVYIDICLKRMMRRSCTKLVMIMESE